MSNCSIFNILKYNFKAVKKILTASCIDFSGWITRAKQKPRSLCSCEAFLMEEGGFEPPKSVTTDLQSAPFGHSGTPPYLTIYSVHLKPGMKPSAAGSCRRGAATERASFHARVEAKLSAVRCDESWWTDSNPRPADYKSAALPAELHQHALAVSENYNSKRIVYCQQKVFPATDENLPSPPGGASSKTAENRRFPWPLIIEMAIMTVYGSFFWRFSFFIHIRVL